MEEYDSGLQRYGNPGFVLRELTLNPAGGSAMKIETKRLILRPFEESDYGKIPMCMRG
jgi:hypothetical protein